MYTLHFGNRRAHFLAMPRTASKACRDAMQRLGAIIHVSHHDISTFRTAVQKGDLIMSSVRNPFDWFVSFWYLNDCPETFDRYVPRLCRKSEWIRRNPDHTHYELFWKYAPLSTAILRYERIEQDFTDAMVNNGFPTPSLEQVGPKKPRPYQTYYRPGVIQLIQNKFNDELMKYGYEF